jgi:hypothetical protein
MPLEGLTPMEQVAPTDHFKIAIIGEPGSGKSWLSVSGVSESEPALVWDFDTRAQSLAGKKYVDVLTRYDLDYPTKMPTVWQKFNEDLQELELMKERKELKYKWFIFDSATFGSEALLRHIMFHEASLRRVVNAAGKLTYIPKSFDTYKAELAEIIGAWQRLSCLGHLVVVFHVDQEKDKAKSTPEKAVYTDKLTVTPPRYADTLALFNEQWLVKATGADAYEVQMKPNYYFVGKTTLKVTETMKADLKEIIETHRRNVGLIK